MLAYDYPLLGVFWTMFVFFIWIAWIFILFKIFADIFRSHDMGGGAKALWVIFVIFLPFLGTFVYLIARGKGMGERDIERLPGAAGGVPGLRAGDGGSAAAPPTSWPSWPTSRHQGVLTDAEYEAQKAKVLG